MANEKAGKGPFVLVYNPGYQIENDSVPWATPRLGFWDKPLPEGWEVWPIVAQYTPRPEPEPRCDRWSPDSARDSVRCVLGLGHPGKHYSRSCVWGDEPEPEPKPDPRAQCSAWTHARTLRCMLVVGHVGDHEYSYSWPRI